VFFTHSPLNLTPVPLNIFYPSLGYSLLSHSRSLRLNALRLLDSKKLVDNNHQNPDANEVVEVLKCCLQGEGVSLDPQGLERGC
jgi:U3 small nucleolar RNA-associated protein 20